AEEVSARVKRRQPTGILIRRRTTSRRARAISGRPRSKPWPVLLRWRWRSDRRGEPGSRRCRLVSIARSRTATFWIISICSERHEKNRFLGGNERWGNWGVRRWHSSCWVHLLALHVQFAAMLCLFCYLSAPFWR